MRFFKIASACGMLSFLIGTLGISSIFYDYMQEGMYQNNVSGYWFGKVGLILSEMHIDLAFSIIIYMISKSKIDRLWAVSIAIVRIFLLILMLAIYWNKGWYYILDPIGSTKFTYIMIVLTIAQTILLLISKSKKTIALRSDKI